MEHFQRLNCLSCRYLGNKYSYLTLRDVSEAAAIVEEVSQKSCYERFRYPTHSFLVARSEKSTNSSISVGMIHYRARSLNMDLWLTSRSQIESDMRLITFLILKYGSFSGLCNFGLRLLLLCGWSDHTASASLKVIGAAYIIRFTSSP